jgi:hypothetical protein
MLGATKAGTATVRLVPDVEDAAEPPAESVALAQ